MKLPPPLSILPFTIWEREWILDYRFTSKWLDILMSSLLSLMEQYRQASLPTGLFYLDGQMLPLLEWMDRTSDDESFIKERIKRLINDGKILIGPMLSSINLSVVSDMTAWKNLKLAEELAEEHSLKLAPIGWLVRNPVITKGVADLLTHFGLKLAIGDSPSNELSGALVSLRGFKSELKVLLRDEENTLLQLSKAPEMALRRLEQAHSRYQLPLLPSGYEYELLLDELQPVVEALSQANNLNFLDEESLSLTNDISPSTTVTALMDNEGMLTARIPLKLQLWAIENLLSKLEFLVALLRANGFNLSDRLPALRELWIALLKSSGRNVLGGTSSDTVQEATERRLSKTFTNAISLIQELVSKVASSLRHDGLLALNSLKRDVIVLVDDEEEKLLRLRGASLSAPDAISLEALGVQPLKLKVSERDHHIEIISSYYTARLFSDGSIQLQWRSKDGSGESVKLSLKPLTRLELGDAYKAETGNEGIEPSLTEVKVLSESPMRIRVEVKHTFSIPSDKGNWLRRSKNSPFQATEQILTKLIEFKAHSPLIEIALSLQNFARDHNLSLELTEVRGRRLTVRRLLGYEEVEASGVIPHMGLLNLSSSNEKVIVLSRGLREAHVLNDNLELTLMRCFQWTASTRESTKRMRPNLFSPLAQLPRAVSYDLAIAVLPPESTLRDISSLYELYQNPPVLFKLATGGTGDVQALTIPLPENMELIGVSNSRDEIQILGFPPEEGGIRVEVMKFSTERALEDESSHPIEVRDLWLGSRLYANLLDHPVIYPEYVNEELELLKVQQVKVESQLLEVLREMDKVPPDTQRYSSLKSKALALNNRRLELNLSRLLLEESFHRHYTDEESEDKEPHEKILSLIEDITLEYILARIEWKLHDEISSIINPSMRHEWLNLLLEIQGG